MFRNIDWYLHVDKIYWGHEVLFTYMYIWSDHCTENGRFKAMNFTKLIKSYENSEEIALHYTNFDVVYHSINIHSSESIIFGTVATPDSPCAGQIIGTT